MSPAAKLFQEAFAKAAPEAAVRAHLAGVKPTGLLDKAGGQGAPDLREIEMVELSEAELLAGES